ncbi:MAG: PD40 domain-containing protein [Myxococcales bacterium]|nr:PD40 domain-containing protein [Myxococcales bacterium]
MTRRRCATLALFVVGATACALTTDLSGLSGGPDPDAGAPLGEAGSTDDAGPFDATTGDDGGTFEAGTGCDPDAPFRPLTSVAGVNTSADEGGPRLTPDELTMYFESERADGPGGSDLYVARRPSLAAPFGPASLVPAMSSPRAEYTATVHPDGLSLVFASNRVDDFALFIARRTSTQDAFGAPVEVSSLETGAIEAHPAFTPAGDALYFTSTRPGGAGGYDLYRAAFVNGTFGMAVRQAELSSASDEVTPVLSRDERYVIFSRKTNAKNDLWKARRASRDVPWEPPTPMTDVVSPSDIFAGWLSPDGCRLYVYTRTPAGDLDIAVATREP